MATTGAMTSRILELAKTVNVRCWLPEDRDRLLELIECYIAEACPDLVASKHNAELYYNMADKQISRVAFNTNQEVVGFTLLTPIHHIQTKVPMLHSVGSYVIEGYRCQGICERMRRAAMVKGKSEGYKMLQGFAYGDKQANSVVKLGGRVVGVVLETPLEE